MSTALARPLRLPRALRHVAAYLRRHDPDLRLRRSVERPALFVLERRVRRRPAVNTAMRNRSDMHVQARDGFLHVSVVHPAWLRHPWNIVRELKETGVDLWAAGGFEKVDDELRYEEHWAKETRRRRRREEFADRARAAYDVMSRLNTGERTRLNNPGLPATPAS